MRIRSQAAFSAVFKRGLRASDRWITVYLARRPSPDLARLGLSVGRRFGGAVRRNRIKRLLREAFRRLRHELPPGTDWVIVPRPGIEPTVAQLQESIRQLARFLLDSDRSRGAIRKHQVP